MWGRGRPGRAAPSGESSPVAPERRFDCSGATWTSPGSDPDQSAKLAPNCGVPDVETPDVLGETVREPVVVILLPLEGR